LFLFLSELSAYELLLAQSRASESSPALDTYLIWC